MKKKNYFSGEFIPKNVDKYKGKYPIKYKSSWELKFMIFLDKNENIISWKYEPFSIKYLDPIRKTTSRYIPDFIIEYIDRYGKRRVAIVEIKPKELTSIKKGKKFSEDKLMSLKNVNKFAFAEAWCKKNNVEFIVLTEENLFRK